MGNDVVDLALPANLGKSEDARFVGRVFTAEERSLIAEAVRPDAILWGFWAAKEAAYKAVSRSNPTVCSIPRQYCLVLDKGNTPGTDPLTAGKVVTPLGELALRILLEKDRVHALAAGSQAALDRLCLHVEELKGDHDPSVMIRGRLLAAIASIMACNVADLRVIKERGGPGVPRVLFRGHPLAAEVSLTHDGRYAAFVFDPTTLPGQADGAASG